MGKTPSYSIKNSNQKILSGSEIIGCAPRNSWLTLQINDYHEPGAARIKGKIKIVNIDINKLSKSNIQAKYPKQFKIINDFHNEYNNKYFDSNKLFEQIVSLTEKGWTTFNDLNSWQLVEVDDSSSTKSKKHVDNFGAGYGDYESNKEVEEAAINVTIQHFESEGWIVDDSYQQKGGGYDLHCRKGNLVKCVEVKGTKGSKESFIITYKEVEQAKQNPDFEIVIVTNALSEPKRNHYSGNEFLEKFELKVETYSAKKK